MKWAIHCELSHVVLGWGTGVCTYLDLNVGQRIVIDSLSSHPIDDLQANGGATASTQSVA